MSYFKRFLLLGSIGVFLLTGLMFASNTKGASTAFASGCNTVATGSWSNNCTVYEGNISNYVLAIQQSIDDYGHGCFTTEDGNFGPNTYTAVMCFQKAKGLSQDGIVGPMTWGALNSTLTFVYSDSTYYYYNNYNTNSPYTFAKNISTGVWWVWSIPHTTWCEMNLSSPC